VEYVSACYVTDKLEELFQRVYDIKITNKHTFVCYYEITYPRQPSKMYDSDQHNDFIRQICSLSSS